MFQSDIQQDTARHLKPFELEQQLQGFCEELSQAGYQQLTINGYVDSVCHFGLWLHRQAIPMKDIDTVVLDQFGKHRCHCPGGRRKCTLSRRYLNRVRRFVGFLAKQGLIHPLPPLALPTPSAECTTFGQWLVSERGLSTTTVANYLRALTRIFPVLGNDPTAYSAASIRSVVRAIAEERGTSEAKHVVSALRAYLRFLVTGDRCSAALIDAVPTVPHWRLSSMPRYVSAVDLERIVDSCDTSSPMGLRDRAILLLLARLGLRAKDIVDLKAADVDWSDATIRVSGKSRQAVRLPLPQDAGNAILSYLEHGRPDAVYPQLFLCTNAPHRPFSCSPTISSIVRAAVVRAGIVDPPSSGTNLIRHSAATAMLRAGASIDAVSTVLRHRSTDTTMHYAKIDVERLSLLAVKWPGSSSC